MAELHTHTDTPEAQAPTIELPQRLARLLALTRLALSAVEDRHNYDGKLQASMSDVQVSITLLGRLHAEVNGHGRVNAIDAASDGIWLRFGGLLGLLDAEAWRMLSEYAEQPPENKLADLEHGLRQLIELGEQTLDAVPVHKTREAEHA